MLHLLPNPSPFSTILKNERRMNPGEERLKIKFSNPLFRIYWRLSVLFVPTKRMGSQVSMDLGLPHPILMVEYVTRGLEKLYRPVKPFVVI